MNRLTLKTAGCRTATAMLCILALPFAVYLPVSFAANPLNSLSTQEKLELGERIYRQGILPNGEPMMAFVKGDLPVSGTALSCISCHMQSGLGSVEGGVFTPPTNGTILFQPYRVPFKGIEQKYFPFPNRRPAYNDASLAEAIRSGDSPAGVVMNDVMPRYLLEDENMAVLITYLKSLSAQFSPGVSDTTIHFATVIADNVRAEERDAMLGPLEQYVMNKNNQAEAFKKPQGKRSRLMAENMLASRELATRRLTLSRWVLKGSPETWRKQLDEYYRKEPVFALLGGIAYGDWNVIHQFSEDNKIPTLLPQTDFPVISGTDWYTLYPSKGYYQEGEAVARYLNNREDIKPERMIVQIVRESREGRALSAGFEETWKDLERPAPVKLMLKVGEKVTGKWLEQLMTKNKPAAILLWDGPDSHSVLELISASPKRAELVFVSSRYLGKHTLTLPKNTRDFTYITYPFSFAQTIKNLSLGSISVEDDSIKRVNMKDVQAQIRTEKISTLSNSITTLLTMALMDMRGNYYRDNFFDVISMVPDQPSTLYGRISFGPGQRYASKGCYIVQLSKGPSPDMIKKSEWVIH